MILDDEFQIILGNIFKAFQVLPEADTTDSLEDLIMGQSLIRHDAQVLKTFSNSYTLID